MRLAIAEADPVAADLLVFVAQRRGHQAVCVPAAERLLERLPFAPAGLVISLPDIDEPGLELLQRLAHGFEGRPIVLLSERTTTLPPLAALRAGANDVVHAPWHPVEVIHRLETWVASRPADPGEGGGIRVADLEVDLEVYSALKAGSSLNLTRLERRLLFCLCQHHPNVAPMERLLVFGWESLEDPDSGLLKTHISHLRRKLRNAGGAPIEIVSHQSIGYSLRVTQAAVAS